MMSSTAAASAAGTQTPTALADAAAQLQTPSLELLGRAPPRRRGPNAAAAADAHWSRALRGGAKPRIPLLMDSHGTLGLWCVLIGHGFGGKAARGRRSAPGLLIRFPPTRPRPAPPRPHLAAGLLWSTPPHPAGSPPGASLLFGEGAGPSWNDWLGYLQALQGSRGPSCGARPSPALRL